MQGLKSWLWCKLFWNQTHFSSLFSDGAKQALNEWHYPGNKAPKKKRNKKKKTANDSIPQVNGDVTPAEEVPNGVVINGKLKLGYKTSTTFIVTFSHSICNWILIKSF